jgi:hypothetical protein
MGPRGDAGVPKGDAEEDPVGGEVIELPWRDKANAFIFALRSSGNRPLAVEGTTAGRLAFESTPKGVEEADIELA